MLPVDLNHRLYDKPFKPFRVHLADGPVISIATAGLVLVGESTAIMPVELGHDSEGYPVAKRWRTVALAHMVQFSDVDEPANGKKKNKKR
jgi:hypothetical protein